MYTSDKIHSKKWIAVICFFLILFNFIPVNASDTNGPTEEANRRVKAGIFNFEGYHARDEEGRLAGYGIEFLHLLSRYSHLNIDYVGYDKSWQEMLDMLERGEIDLVTSARKTPEREAKFAFSHPIGRNSTVISVLAGNEKFRNWDYNTYNGMRIGLLRGSSQNGLLPEFAKKNQFSYVPIEYANSDKLLAALQKGNIDAILTSNLRSRKGERTLDVLQSDRFFVTVRKNDIELLEEINYAIEQMDINEGDWENSLFLKYYGPSSLSELIFTEREKLYLQEVIAGKKKITVMSSDDRAPYSYLEDGELKGIIPDFFAEVMKLCNLPYEIVVPKNRANYYATVETNGVDVVIDRKASDMPKAENLCRGFNTDSYMSVGVAKVTRKNFADEIKTVAVVKNQGGEPLENNLIGDAEVLYCNTREDTLAAVTDGRADAAYMYTYTAQMAVNNDLGGHLQYSIVNNVRYSFHMYVRETTDHELVTILNKCMKHLADDTLNRLVAEYTSHNMPHVSLAQYINSNPEAKLLIVMSVIFTLFIVMALLLWIGWKEKNMHLLEDQFAIVGALSREYLNVFLINAEEGTAKIVKLDGYVTAGLEKNSRKPFPYEYYVQQYVDERVYPEDKESLLAEMSLNTVMAELSSHVEYGGTYRALIDGKIHNLQYTFIKVGDAKSHDGFAILVGFRNIDDIVREEQEQKQILEKALAQAQYASNAKTMFLNNMSHDIRTPMNAIIGFSTLASTHINSKEAVQDYLAKITTSSKHLLSLINDVLDMSRIESGKVKIKEEEANLPEILHDLKTIVQPDIKAKQFDFFIDTQNVTNETIMCDRLRLNQVLLNVLSNSMKYTKAGGTISLRIAQTNSEPTGYASYQFRIKDTGIGMSKEFLDHLFEPFERESTSTVSGIQGTGLGLAITKSITEMMHGTVTVTSEVDKGTEFVLSFRFRTVDRPHKAEHLEQLAGQQVLIVDDDINTCMSVSGMLASIGMNPCWTTQGTEAEIKTELAIEAKNPYNAYIIDMRMPDTNGIDVVRKIRKLIGNTATIIILTAYDCADIEDDAKEAGATACCSKPIFLSELQQILTAPYRTGKPREDTGEQLEELWKGTRILLVEDNELNQEIAQEILGSMGLVVDTVSDGTEAVDTVKNVEADTYALILMDVQMPIMDGYEATRQIRAMEDPRRSSIPIIAMTANAFEEDKQKAMEAGMNGHVAKPIDIPQLISILKDILTVDA